MPSPERTPAVVAIIWVVRLTPLLGSVFALWLAGRGVLTGSLITGGGRTRERRVERASAPIQFWVQICLHVFAAIVLLVFGIAAFAI